MERLHILLVWIPHPRNQHACQNTSTTPKAPSSHHSGSWFPGSFIRWAHPCLAFPRLPQHFPRSSHHWNNHHHPITPRLRYCSRSPPQICITGFKPIVRATPTSRPARATTEVYLFLAKIALQPEIVGNRFHFVILHLLVVYLLPYLLGHVRGFSSGRRSSFHSSPLMITAWG